jgi:hypothetical protein
VFDQVKHCKVSYIQRLTLREFSASYVTNLEWILRYLIKKIVDYQALLIIMTGLDGGPVSPGCGPLKRLKHFGPFSLPRIKAVARSSLVTSVQSYLSLFLSSSSGYQQRDGHYCS